jgi:hypothetical protein
MTQTISSEGIIFFKNKTIKTNLLGAAAAILAGKRAGHCV